MLRSAPAALVVRRPMPSELSHNTSGMRHPSVSALRPARERSVSHASAHGSPVTPRAHATSGRARPALPG
eukprot:9244226-Heterocapsa_arctica.AAC.1